jgi:hypothetical protein
LSALGAAGGLVWWEEGSIRWVRAGECDEGAIGGRIERPGRLFVSDDLGLVALIWDQDFFQGDLEVWSIEDGRRKWRLKRVDRVEFSADGTRMMWRFDEPQQSGSDLFRFGVVDARSGRRLRSWSSTYWQEEVWFDAGGSRIVLGEWGKRPKKVFVVGEAVQEGPADEITGAPPRDPPRAVRSWEAFRAGRP